MKSRIFAIVAAVSALCVSSWGFAAAADAPAKDKSATQRPRPGRGAGNGGLGGGQLGGMLGGGQFAQAMTALGELSLTPDFSLTRGQKEKLQAIRDEFKTQMDKWRTEHEAEITELRDQAGEMLRGGAGDPQKRQELMQRRQALIATAPNGDAAVKQIKELLTEDQLKPFETKLAERQAGADQTRQQLRERLRDGAGGGGKGGGGGRNRANRGGAKGGV